MKGSGLDLSVIVIPGSNNKNAVLKKEILASLPAEMKEVRKRKSFKSIR
jgi:hypothetical protein